MKFAELFLFARYCRRASLDSSAESVLTPSLEPRSYRPRERRGVGTLRVRATRRSKFKSMQSSSRRHKRTTDESGSHVHVAQKDLLTHAHRSSSVWVNRTKRHVLPSPRHINREGGGRVPGAAVVSTTPCCEGPTPRPGGLGERRGTSPTAGPPCDGPRKCRRASATFRPRPAPPTAAARPHRTTTRRRA